MPTSVVPLQRPPCAVLARGCHPFGRPRSHQCLPAVVSGILAENILLIEFTLEFELDASKDLRFTA